MIIDDVDLDITVDTDMMDALDAPLPSSPPPPQIDMKKKEEDEDGT